MINKYIKKQNEIKSNLQKLQLTLKQVSKLLLTNIMNYPIHRDTSEPSYFSTLDATDFAPRG